MQPSPRQHDDLDGARALVKAAIEGRLPGGIGVTALRDAPAEWSLHFERLGLAQSLFSLSPENNAHTAYPRPNLASHCDFNSRHSKQIQCLPEKFPTQQNRELSYQNREIYRE
jgi:hypothetical protein